MPLRETGVEVVQLLGFNGDPGSTRCTRDMDCLHGRGCSPIESFLEIWPLSGPLWPVFVLALTVQALRGLPCWGPSLLFISGT